jgi:hypothetical protein
MLEEREYTWRKTVALKPRIDIVLNKIKNEVTKLAYIYTELEKIEVEIRESNSSFSNNHEFYKHRVSSPTELFQSKRRGMTVIMSMMSFETVADRLQAARNINEVVNALKPTIAVMKNIRSALIRYVSGAQEQITDICDMLELILIDACQLSNGVLDFKEANHEAILLLNEAHLKAEEKMQEEFPGLMSFFIKRTS